MKFDSMNLIDPILRAIQSEGYEKPTPIQAEAIPHILSRKDVLACAQTGTGKTAAFALPMLQLLNESCKSSQGQRPIRALILTPTRELASQIQDSFSAYGKSLPLRNAVIFGGVGQKPQVRALKSGVDILVATPGRLLDLMRQRLVDFRGLEILVLDEADRMLDMGFINDVRKVIAALPRKRQTLFFSATMPPEIRKLSEQILSHPVRIEVTPVASTAEKIDQTIYHVEKRLKTSLLIRLIEEAKVERGLVFTRTKRDANRVADCLNGAGIRASAIHGNKSQGARERALESIKRGECRLLVATDIAARGIDIDKVTHVFNHDIPNVPESYVHRIGRTARAGTEGSALSFCSREEKSFLSDIERLIRKRISVAPTPEGLLSEVKLPHKGEGNREEHRNSRKEFRGHRDVGRFGRPSRRGSSRVNSSMSRAGSHAGGPAAVPAGNKTVKMNMPQGSSINPSDNNRRARRLAAGLTERWQQSQSASQNV